MRLFVVKLIEAIPLLVRRMHPHHGVIMGLQVWRLLLIEGNSSIGRTSSGMILLLGIHHWSFLPWSLHVHVDAVIMLLVELVYLKHGRWHLKEVLESIHR